MEWNVPATSWLATPCDSSSESRSFSSPAALLVNVMMSTLPGAFPSCSRRATRAVTTRVLPEPGPALTRTWWRAQCTAAACSSLRLARYSATLASALLASAPGGAVPEVGRGAGFVPLRARGLRPAPRPLLLRRLVSAVLLHATLFWGGGLWLEAHRATPGLAARRITGVTAAALAAALAPMCEPCNLALWSCMVAALEARCSPTIHGPQGLGDAVAARSRGGGHGGVISSHKTPRIGPRAPNGVGGGSGRRSRRAARAARAAVRTCWPRRAPSPVHLRATHHIAALAHPGSVQRPRSDRVRCDEGARGTFAIVARSNRMDAVRRASRTSLDSPCRVDALPHARRTSRATHARTQTTPEEARYPEARSAQAPACGDVRDRVPRPLGKEPQLIWRQAGTPPCLNRADEPFSSLSARPAKALWRLSSSTRPAGCQRSRGRGGGLRGRPGRLAKP
eukprot:364836-Chlamydomonas_euryale.AAC.11